MVKENSHNSAQELENFLEDRNLKIILNKYKLTFQDKTTENNYRTEVINGLQKTLQIGILVGIFIYSSFLIYDFLTASPNISLLLLNRVVISAISFMYFIASFFNVLKKYYFFSLASLFLIVGFGSINLSIIEDDYNTAIYSVIIFFTVVPFYTIALAVFCNLLLVIVLFLSLLFFTDKEMYLILKQIFLLMSFISAGLLLLYIKQTIERVNYIKTKKIEYANKQISIKNKELLKAKRQAEESEMQLRELNATKDKFFTIIAHDLRNPFNIILAFSNMLLEGIANKDSDKIEKYAVNVHTTANQTYELLQNLLEWSRIQQGILIPVFQKTNLKHIAEEICMLSNEMAVDKGIKLENNIRDDIYLNCDKDMTKTILRNLISNAIKFTNCGGTVTLNSISNNNITEIQISDNGVGIIPEKLPHLFSIEKNISTKGTNKEKGSGLGLILCKEFVEKQGGKIWVESESGKGSDFKFTLPVFKA